MSRQPLSRRVVWRRWLALAGLLIIIGVAMFIAGIWGDNRWAATGCIFFFPGVIGFIVSALCLDELPSDA